MNENPLCGELFSGLCHLLALKGGFLLLVMNFAEVPTHFCVGELINSPDSECPLFSGE